MSGFVEGIDRSQSAFCPALPDDYVAEDNLVRAGDAFVEGLDLGKLGFGRVAPLRNRAAASSRWLGLKSHADQVSPRPSAWRPDSPRTPDRRHRSGTSALLDMDLETSRPPTTPAGQMTS